MPTAKRKTNEVSSRARTLYNTRNKTELAAMLANLELHVNAEQPTAGEDAIVVKNWFLRMFTANIWFRWVSFALLVIVVVLLTLQVRSWFHPDNAAPSTGNQATEQKRIDRSDSILQKLDEIYRRQDSLEKKYSLYVEREKENLALLNAELLKKKSNAI